MKLTDSVRDPKLGQMVFIKQGRDAGRYAVIVSLIDDRFVLVADGLKKKIDRPKKKNLIHLKLQDEVCREVVESIEETGRVTNGKLRFVIQRFIDQQRSSVDGQ